MNKKRICCLIVALMMVLSTFSMTVSARENEDESASVGCDPLWFEVQDLLEDAYALTEAEDQYTYESRMALKEVADSVDIISSGSGTLAYIQEAIDALVPIGSEEESVREYALMGDADNNEKVNIRDATLIQKHVADITYIDDAVSFFADVDGDTYVTVKDATAIQMTLASLGRYYGIGYEATSKTNRYYFYMPEQWLNEYTADTGNTAGIYWWEGTHPHDSWPGIPAKKGDVEGVYYYDVPVDVTTVIWNNYLDGGVDRYEPVYYYSMQTRNIGTEWYDPGESDLYPEGTDDFDNMIYIVDFSNTGFSGECGSRHSFGGEWYYYYGNGEYGTSPIKGESEILTERAFNVEEYCFSCGNSYTNPTVPERPPVKPEPEKPEVTDTNRYYFYLPEEWLNESTQTTGNTAGIYWWEGTDYCDYWPGIPAKKGDAEGVYYYDVPVDVTTIIWNNYFDGGADPTTPYYEDAFMTRNIGTEWYDPGESDLYPDGLDSFDGMIFVVDFTIYDFNDLSKPQFGGEWYYYYGNGEYGTAPIRGESEILTDSALNRGCFQPD